MSVTQGEVKPRSNGPNRPAAQRRRQQARRRASGSLLRRPFGRRRPPTRSPRSRASSGARGGLRGRRSSPEQSSGRRPEFGNLWPRHCGARQWRRRVPTGSWRHQEHGDARGRDRLGLVPPWRHGRRRGAIGSSEKAAGVRERARGGGEMEEELTARSMSSSVVSGRRRRRRIDRGKLRWPATETVMVAALQRVRDLVAR